jgi:hypothetical protein
VLAQTRSESSYVLESIWYFVALARVVVPVELVWLLPLRKLVRPIAVGLVFREPALAKPGFFSFDDVACGSLWSALYDTRHKNLKPINEGQTYIRYGRPRFHYRRRHSEDPQPARLPPRH